MKGQDKFEEIFECYEEYLRRQDGILQSRAYLRDSAF